MVLLDPSTPEQTERTRCLAAELPLDLMTPVGGARALRAAGRRVALLESAGGPSQLLRWSFLACDPDGELTVTDRGTQLTLPDYARPGTAEPVHGSATLGLLRRAQQATALPRVGRELPPFRGGWVGFLGHELIHELEPRVPLPQADPTGAPRARFSHFRHVVAFDHASQRLLLLATCPGGAADRDRALEALHALALDLSARSGQSLPDEEFELLDAKPRSVTEPEHFEAGVRQLRSEIARGEVFQAVLSQRFEQRYRGDAFAVYRTLRRTNPAPHLFFYEGEFGALLGSSPERLCSLSDRRAETLPIAGTRPRGGDADEDRRLARELLADPKERAEHDMLVDLARNDLARVSCYGSVQVAEHAVPRVFPRVQHLVSRVTGELRAGRDACDLLASCFPAGTVSGAPKVRALELITELEGARRGAYAGAFGYLDDAGDLDVAITLRSIYADGQRMHVQAGAGVVFDSVPAREREETQHKASAVLEAILAAGRLSQRAEVLA